jgi:hypothetical protein
MKFKVMDWVRKVRDDNYEKCKKMGQNEKIAHTKKMADTFAKKQSKVGSSK